MEDWVDSLGEDIQSRLGVTGGSHPYVTAHHLSQKGPWAMPRRCNGGDCARHQKSPARSPDHVA